MECHVDFSCSAPYYTLNELGGHTTDLWIVCPGYGQLAKYFIRRFDVFDSQKHFVVALQGLSKFYLPDQKHVGASWMTKEDRETEMRNQQAYFDAVMIAVLQGRVLNDFNIHLMGFSQGVSMISRMAAYAKIDFKNLILWAGGFPPELSKADFSHLSMYAKLKVVIGTQDEFYALGKNYQTEIEKMEVAIGLKPEVITFEGKHEVQREVLQRCLE
ncbi:alpha/beta hydrolase [Reichenbachiella carrageenanivorans]|uniref:Alpha/beta hydrolase n=1 Tax=Reichenbachiella carrageenanivorans TaxID=2979869 RepID=A0ABY6CYL6_9BACT|nr:alpha/beta hydrolase [Reichenbachiella carrageenanivorans]UXX78465.1 alpha/beta hydrolase [Reichenbachiella carrageenanivorans]